jgi:exosome complex RNA-binding protein Rrp42 (RNase PH superfamily)
MDPELLRQIDPKDFYEAHLKENLRPDYRKVLTCRKLAISLKDNDTTCMVRLGSTSVLLSLSEGSGFEGWSDLSHLGKAPGQVRISILADDGNLLEAITLGYQILIKKSDILFPFTFCELFGFYIRDPTKEEEKMSRCTLTIFLSESGKINIMKTQGSPIALADIQKLVSNCQLWASRASHKMSMLQANKTFIGKLYSSKS